MAKQQRQSTRVDPLIQLIISGAAAWGLAFIWSFWDTEYCWLPALLLLAALKLPFDLLRWALIQLISKLGRVIANTPSTNHGSARWATLRDFRDELNPNSGPFWGMLDGKPLFIDYESSALTVAPAGLGKTTCTVIPNLCSMPASMGLIVPDYKNELAVMTKSVREGLGQQVVCLNPSGINEDILGPAARYNPLVILCDDWDGSQSDMIADARGMALRLSPEPARAGENEFFRKGARNLITFVLLYLVIHLGHGANLSEALRLIRDPSRLKGALYEASVSEALKGELADLANDLLAKLSDGDTRQVESFREGALQALEVFSPSGRIAESVSACDFRFRDTKNAPGTIYVIGDPTRMAVYAPWMGLTMWCALTELVRCRSHKPVMLLLDEATNFKIEGLPEQLTRLRGFGVRVHIIIQELEDWARVYGREALEILLSQTEIQQFFGSKSQTTLELLSKRLGETTVKTENYSLRQNLAAPVSKSLGETSRPLLKTNEIERHGDTLLFVRRKPPASVERVSCSEVEPWSEQVDVNPLHGTKLKGKTKLRL